MKVIAFHLFNDYSGSPKVLMTILKGLLKHGFSVSLYTSDGGVLDELSIFSNFTKQSVKYKFSQDSYIKTSMRFLRSNLIFFIKSLLLKKSPDQIVYLNTLMPFGAALGSKIRGDKIIYHYHENAFAKGRIYKFLAWIMQKLADKIICVSSFQASFLERKDNVFIIPNSVSDEYLNKLNLNIKQSFQNQRILMLASLKAYKGTSEFLKLAKELSNYNFELVLNEDEAVVKEFIISSGSDKISNLKIFPRQKDVSQFYNKATLVINLTNKDLAIETFGLTVIEAMAAGVPVIVPTVGGIAELVEDDVNGYKIDVQNLDLIKYRIKTILSDENKYFDLSSNALKLSKQYSEKETIEKIIKVISC